MTQKAENWLLLCSIMCGCQAFLPSGMPSISSPYMTTIKEARSWGRASMGAVAKVTGEELEKALSEASGPPVVLDVYATWCGPCSILAGELDKVAGLYGDKIRILKVDSDEEPRIASALRVYGLPTIFLILKGQLVHRVEGALPASELTKLINHHLFGAPADGTAVG